MESMMFSTELFGTISELVIGTISAAFIGKLSRFELFGDNAKVFLVSSIFLRTKCFNNSVPDKMLGISISLDCTLT